MRVEANTRLSRFDPPPIRNGEFEGPFGGGVLVVAELEPDFASLSGNQRQIGLELRRDMLDGLFLHPAPVVLDRGTREERESDLGAGWRFRKGQWSEVRIGGWQARQQVALD